MKKKFSIINVSDAFLSNFWCFLKAWKVWLSYAMALFLLSAVCANWSHSCKDNISPFWWCFSSSNIYVAYIRFVLYFAITLFISFGFIYDIYQGGFDNEKSKFSAILKITKPKLKFIFFSFGLCTLFIALLGVCFWLVFRAANPNWLVEFGLFFVVFSFATMAVLILRTSASFGMFLMYEKIPDFKYIFQKTQGKFYVVLVTFCLLIYISNLLLIRVLGFLDFLNLEKSSFALVLGSEFLSSVFKFLMIAAYGAYFLAMAQILEQKENVSEKEITAPIKSTQKKKKSATKQAAKSAKSTAKKNNTQNKSKAQRKRG